MAWIYSQALADSLSHSASGSDPSPIVKTTDMLSRCCCQECMIGHCLELQSGTTLHRLEGPCYQVQSTSSARGFPVKISALRDVERAWQESKADFIGKSKGLFAKQTRDLYFSKTYQQLELGASTLSSSHLPSSGMIVGGRLYQPRKLEPRTLEKGGSYWPTPAATDWKDWNYTKGHGKHSPRLTRFLFLNYGMYPTVQLYEWLMNFPARWAKLDPWATRWFRPKRAKPSKD